MYSNPKTKAAFTIAIMIKVSCSAYSLQTYTKILYEAYYIHVTNSTQYTLKQTSVPGNIIIHKNLWTR